MPQVDGEEGRGLARYEEEVRRELRVLIAEKDLLQKEVAAGLEKLGIPETTKGLSAKLRAGTYSAAYYLALKEAIKRL